MTCVKTILVWVTIFTVQFADAQRLDRVIDLRGTWKFNIGDRPHWANVSYDDTNWEKVRVPSAWEDQGFNGYDGYAWYRTTFDGSELRSEKDIFLNLGYIDDTDEVYLNGNLIGLSGNFPPDFQTAWEAKRLYYIPLEYLDVRGENTLAVRVYDVVHGGGIISGDIGLYSAGNTLANVVFLEGVWKFEEGDGEEWKDQDYDDGHWENKVVPGYWKAGDIKDFYASKWGKLSYAWYRKTFRVPGRFDGRQMTLILGKIDDFDEVYLNGELIGTTNDGRPFGRSNSYRQTRIYDIPIGLLNTRGWNVIAVRVTDMGGEAGIYKGPVGIVDSDDLGRFIRWGG